MVGGGAGWMGSQPLGSQFSVFEVATEMIRVSDNTATNLLIQRLGGKDSLNSRFRVGTGGHRDQQLAARSWKAPTPPHPGIRRAIALVETGQTLSPAAATCFAKPWAPHAPTP